MDHRRRTTRGVSSSSSTSGKTGAWLFHMPRDSQGWSSTRVLSNPEMNVIVKGGNWEHLHFVQSTLLVHLIGDPKGPKHLKKLIFTPLYS